MLLNHYLAYILTSGFSQKKNKPNQSTLFSDVSTNPKLKKLNRISCYLRSIKAFRFAQENAIHDYLLGFPGRTFSSRGIGVTGFLSEKDDIIELIF